ncbi:MAG: phosphoribosyltransferase family protein [Gammaproteobacteria bacterium]|nr:phosphoribosyltransferase family protein [Gammaproteobacteria bacterium]
MVYKWLKNKLLKRVSNQCLLCLAPTHNTHLICRGCKEDLPKNQYHCVICSLPFAPAEARKQLLVCGHCQKNPPTYTTSVIPHLYAAPIKQLISQFKFHSNLTYASLLAQNFVHVIKQRKNNLPDCIIPVPLHQQRLQERGFNQALELSRMIASQLNIPLDYSLCQRAKATPYQSGLSAKQRKQNLKNAFHVTRSHSYKHVVIFDDVVTTGTTVNELAKQLKKSGVEIIEVWAIARTSNKNE